MHRFTLAPRLILLASLSSLPLVAAAQSPASARATPSAIRSQNLIKLSICPPQVNVGEPFVIKGAVSNTGTDLGGPYPVTGVELTALFPTAMAVLTLEATRSAWALQTLRALLDLGAMAANEEVGFTVTGSVSSAGTYTVDFEGKQNEFNPGDFKAACTFTAVEASGLNVTVDVDGILRVSWLDGDRTVTVTNVGGFVKVNGQDPDVGPIAADLINGIVINAGPGSDVVDVSAVTPETFTGIEGELPIRITASTGADQVLGSAFDDFVFTGIGGNVQGNDGDDLFSFHPEFGTAGELPGTFLDGGDGQNEVRYEGTDGSETLTLGPGEWRVATVDAAGTVFLDETDLWDFFLGGGDDNFVVTWSAAWADFEITMRDVDGGEGWDNLMLESDAFTAVSDVASFLFSEEGDLAVTLNDLAFTLEAIDNIFVNTYDGTDRVEVDLIALLDFIDAARARGFEEETGAIFSFSGPAEVYLNGTEGDDDFRVCPVVLPLFGDPVGWGISRTSCDDVHLKVRASSSLNWLVPGAGVDVLRMTGTPDDDTFRFMPLPFGAGNHSLRLDWNDYHPLLIAPGGNLTVEADGGDGQNELVVKGTPQDDFIDVLIETVQAIPFLNPAPINFQYSNMANLTIEPSSGNDVVRTRGLEGVSQTIQGGPDGSDKQGADQDSLFVRTEGRTYTDDGSTVQIEGMGPITYAAFAHVSFLTSVAAEPPETLVSAPVLSAPYPNPFRARTALTLTLPESQRVRVAVYDVLGREVARLHEGPLSGTHTFTLDGAALPGGLYLIRAAGTDFDATRRVVLVR